MYYRRVLLAEAVYYSEFINRKSTLLVDHIDKLRTAFQRVHYLYPFEIVGIVIFPDHFHMLINLPVGDSNYSLRVR